MTVDRARLRELCEKLTSKLSAKEKRRKLMPLEELCYEVVAALLDEIEHKEGLLEEWTRILVYCPGCAVPHTTHDSCACDHCGLVRRTRAELAGTGEVSRGSEWAMEKAREVMDQVLKAQELTRGGYGGPPPIEPIATALDELRAENELLRQTLAAVDRVVAAAREALGK